MSSKKFKVGDRVEVVEQVDGNSAIIGFKGVVAAVRSYGKLNYAVDFARPFKHSHGCQGEVESGNGFWCSGRSLRLVEVKKSKIKKEK